MSIQKALEKVGDDAILKEMLMTIKEKEEIEGVKLESLTNEENKRVIPSNFKGEV